MDYTEILSQLRLQREQVEQAPRAMEELARITGQRRRGRPRRAFGKQTGIEPASDDFAGTAAMVTAQ